MCVVEHYDRCVSYVTFPARLVLSPICGDCECRIAPATVLVLVGALSSLTQMFESIKQNSAGFVQGMEQMANFDIKDGERKLFIFYRKLE